MNARRATALCAVLALSCVASGPPRDTSLRIREALIDLDREGFRFEGDVRFRTDPYAVCEGVACADLVLTQERRTILISPDVIGRPAALRATLLEVWERYRAPRPGSLPDLARGALRVVRDGPRVGVDDPDLILRAQFTYRQLYESLSPAERGDLPEPDAVRPGMEPSTTRSTPPSL